MTFKNGDQHAKVEWNPDTVPSNFHTIEALLHSFSGKRTKTAVLYCDIVK